MVASGFAEPVGLAAWPDKASHVVVVERIGKLWDLDLSNGDRNLVLDLSDRVQSDRNLEQGLLGLAFSPSGWNQNQLYVQYTRQPDGHIVIARIPFNPESFQAEPEKEEILLTIAKTAPHHNGGQLLFGPDGYLYIGIGDGGESGATAQDPANLLGSILRIDVNASPGYRIPSGNPWKPNSDGAPEIIAMGLRNPWRFSFSADGRFLFIGDVGESKWEEIDLLPLGLDSVPNFGWIQAEGPECSQYHPDCSLDEFTPPLYSYTHDSNCSAVIGGVDLGDRYIYGDFCQQFIAELKQDDDGGWRSETLFEVEFRPTGFFRGPNQEILITTLQGDIYSLSWSPP
jgi:hypothetical protein